jgi:hypothetical protein
VHIKGTISELVKIVRLKKAGDVSPVPARSVPTRTWSSRLPKKPLTPGDLAIIGSTALALSQTTHNLCTHLYPAHFSPSDFYQNSDVYNTHIVYSLFNCENLKLGSKLTANKTNGTLHTTV